MCATALTLILCEKAFLKTQVLIYFLSSLITEGSGVVNLTVDISIITITRTILKAFQSRAVGRGPGRGGPHVACRI